MSLKLRDRERPQPLERLSPMARDHHTDVVERFKALDGRDPVAFTGPESWALSQREDVSAPQIAEGRRILIPFVDRSHLDALTLV